MEPQGWHSRGYLPHLNGGEMAQMVTFRLHGALPQELIERCRHELRRLPPANARVELHRQLEAHLDRGQGPRWLDQPALASLVERAMVHFDRTRYRLIAWVVMCNHVHALFTPILPHDVTSIVFSWRSFTANQANALLGRTGRFWDRDYFDRFIRDEAHLNRAIEYIEMNPVKAGLCSRPSQWPHGSARLGRDL